VYDLNCDDKISEIDLFKLFQGFDGKLQPIFESAFEKDICLLTKIIKEKKERSSHVRVISKKDREV
jgi:hypothetical protein